MAGSLWKDFYSKGLSEPYGLELPPGLDLMAPFAETMFTPTDKSETDDPIDALETATHYSDAYFLALQTYEMGREFASTRGIELIDGKFELGTDSDGNLVLGDECLTPDSCRFVLADGITVGQEPAWLDKQYLREAAEAIWAGGPKTPLEFPRTAIDGTVARYEEIARTLIGRPLTAFQADVLS
jgi:phosphoribosylaminoimidazole-succinocarboxamide synthase